jgi:class 3 adenylate cyclase
VAEGQRGGRERKLVTVLFADVTGSTTLGERLDPERMREVMDAFFAAMRAEIEAEGGTVEKFIGDAVMAAFGVPHAHEDDPARALRAALHMLQRLEVVNQDLTKDHDVTLEVRIGVNTGEVLATTEPRPGESMVTGDAVNAASRLEAAAAPGQVIASERTVRAVRGFRVEDMGALDLKGKARRVHAFRVLDETTTLPERGVPGLRAPLVGRDDEIDLLESIYGRVASEGRPHLITLYGDAGVGKSRLTREFLDRLGDQALVLHGRCLPYGEGVTFWPLAEILKAHAGVLDTDPSDIALERIQKAGLDLLTEDVTIDPGRTTAALAFTVGVEDPA